MLSKEELLKMAEKQNAKATHAYFMYQETGTSRYDRERRNAEDLADALRAAANAAEDHAMMVTYKCELADLVGRADKALMSGSDGKDILLALVAKAGYLGVNINYRKEENK